MIKKNCFQCNTEFRSVFSSILSVGIKHLLGFVALSSFKVALPCAPNLENLPSCKRSKKHGTDSQVKVCECRLKYIGRVTGDSTCKSTEYILNNEE